LLRIRKPGVVERHLGGSDGKLRVAIESLQAVGRKMIFRDPVGNFAAAMRVKFGRIETGDPLDAALLGAQAAPKIVPAGSDAGDRTDARNNCATPGHLRLWFGVLSLEVRFHATEGLGCHRVDKAVADDRFRNRREEGDSKVEVMDDLDEDTRRRFLE
jgi:hypothetical protein